MPDLLFAELGNILWKKQSRQGLEAEDAQAIVGAVSRLPLDTIPTTVVLEEAHQLATTYGRTVYDALYLAVSLREGCPLVTADERLVNAVTPSLPNVILLSSWQ